MMTNNNQENSGIVIDPKSGISEEEQRQILAQINSIAEKNRLSLSEGNNGKGKKPRFKAKRSGGVFPVVINIAAVAALAGGLFLLSSMHGKTDAHVRTGAKVYNSAERALIEEIRKETLSLLEAKENEISLISSKLEEIDAELLSTLSGGGLTAEGKQNRERLLALQEEYRSTLSGLQDERSQILEDARAKEAVLQAQLESRARELAAVSQQSAEAIGLAHGELERLEKEQNQAAAVEAEMGAFFANLNRQVADNRLDEAAGTIKTARDFINTPAFQALRSIQARKDMYLRTINAFEAMIDETRKYQAALNNENPFLEGNPISDMQSTIARLEQNLAEKEKTIDALSSQGSGASRRLNELERANNALQTEKRQLERTNSTLQTQNSQLERTNNTLQTQNSQLERTNNTLRTQNSQLTADLDKQTQTAAATQQNLTQTTARFQQAESDLQKEKAETARLNQTVSDRETSIRSRDATISAREATIANRDDVIRRIRNEVELDQEYDLIPPAEIKARISRIQTALRALTQ
jgi:chromosome segregation ATPase